MSLLLSALAFGLVTTGQEPKTYKDAKLDLTYQYPANWTMKEEKFSTDFTFPLSDGSTATVQVFRMAFRQPKSDWQQIQVDVNGQLKRTIARQWEETILGVPMLMTRIFYTDGEKEMSAMVGLLYTATAEKLNFRVSSTRAMASEAEMGWRDVLVTLRTISGQLPQPEDPTRPNPVPVQGNNVKPVTTLKPDNGPEAPVRTKNTANFKRLEVSLTAYMPEGWTFEDKDDKLTLRNPEVKSPLTLTIIAGARTDIEPMLKAAEKQSFARFNIVGVRQDMAAKRMKSGTFVADTLRTGTKKEGGFLAVWHIAGHIDTVLWRLDYECSSEADLKKERKVMEKLRDLFAVEIVK